MVNRWEGYPTNQAIHDATKGDQNEQDARQKTRTVAAMAHANQRPARVMKSRTDDAAQP